VALASAPHVVLMHEAAAQHTTSGSATALRKEHLVPQMHQAVRQHEHVIFHPARVRIEKICRGDARARHLLPLPPPACCRHEFWGPKTPAMQLADGEATGMQREEQGRQLREIPESIIIVCRI
jgi:hypothetical protein